MSLPKTTKETHSENPGKNAVTSPNDPAQKERDVDRKMRLYGIVEGFRQGKLPSNRQIDETLNYFTSTAPFDESQLSSEGKNLIKQFRTVVQDANELIKTKNHDELLQNFIWHTEKFDGKGHAENVKGVSAPASKDEIQGDGEQAVEHLRVLGKLIFTNSEVRKLLSDITVIGRDVLADGAEKAAQHARPDEDRLRSAEEPGPDAQWVGKDGQTRGPNEPVPQTGIGEKVEQAKVAKNEAQQQKENAKAEASNQAQQQAQQSQNRVQSDANPNDRDQQADVARDEASRVGGKAQQQAQETKNRVMGAIPQERKDQMRDTAHKQKEDAINYAKEKFPEERREKFIYRLKKVIVEQQKHDDYNQAIEFFIDVLSKYKGRAVDVKEQSKGKGGDIRSDPIYATAEMELRILLERFANNTSMQPIFDAVDVMYADANNDPELREWWDNFAEYVRAVLQDEGYVLEDQCTEDGKRLKETGRKFWDEKYRGHREDLFHAIEEFFLSYNQDPMNRKLGEDVKQLVKDLALDGDGNLKYKPHLINDLRRVIIPQITQQIGYVPIPRAEYTDKQFDIVIENLSLEISNLLPNLIEIENRNFFRLSPFAQQGDFQQHSFKIGFSQIQADIRDVSFYWKKKSGFPKMADHGLADVVIAGKGIYGDIALETTPDKVSVFRVKNVDINIDDLKFKIRDSKHNFLYNLVRTTATGLIKKAVCKAAEVAIRNALVQLDQQLSDIREASNEASRRDDLSRTDAIKQRMDEKKRNAEQNKEKSKQTAEERGSQFKLVTTREQEIVHFESKYSHIAKQGELAEQAKRGDAGGWKSPIFDITHTSPTLNKDLANNSV